MWKRKGNDRLCPKLLSCYFYLKLFYFDNPHLTQQPRGRLQQYRFAILRHLNSKTVSGVRREGCLDKRPFQSGGERCALD